jgi:hypothetical protein
MSAKQPPLQLSVKSGAGRVETGAVQFQGDWPGLFIRGDTAKVVAWAIRELQNRVATTDPVVGVALSRLAPIADIVERDVQVGAT